jgi:S1-C subfamily serine protease
VRRKLGTGAAVLAAALLGGGAAVAIGSTVWDGGTTTVVREVDAGTDGASAAFESSSASGTIGDIYDRVAPGVVQVTSSVVTNDPFFGPSQAQSLGSGFVIDKEGHIVTNYHVVENADEVYVNFSRDDGLRAKIVGVDPSTDLALLKIDAHKRALTPLQLGDSDAVHVGDQVVAIGSPYGRDRTVTAGIVSALQREIQAPNGFTIDKVIQTDAPINRGNSGGPLLNGRGQVIGVNSQIQSDTGGNVGIGFAVPVNTLKEVASELIRRGRVDHAYLGVQMQTVDKAVANLFHLPEKGVLVTRVEPGGPADRAGLKGGETSVVVDGTTYVLGGDVVTEVDGHAIDSADELRELVTSKEPGDKLRLQVQRGDDQESVTVELGRQPMNASAG